MKIQGEKHDIANRVSVLLYVVLMIAAAVAAVVICACIMVGSFFDYGICKDVFLYISFVLSVVTLLPSIKSGIRTKMQKNEPLTIVGCILLATLYATIRIVLIPDVCQFEEILMAIFMLVGFILVFFDNK